MTQYFPVAGGIPTIIKPFFGDQFFWADRVEALGIGTAVRKLTVESLTQALITATTDQKQIARAKTVGEKIRAVRPLIWHLETRTHCFLGGRSGHRDRGYLP